MEGGEKEKEEEEEDEDEERGSYDKILLSPPFLRGKTRPVEK